MKGSPRPHRSSVFCNCPRSTSSSLDAGRRQVAHRKRPANHSSPTATARGITGRAAPSIASVLPQGSQAMRNSSPCRRADCTVTRRGGAGGPNGLCILEPELERGRRNRSLGLIRIVGIRDARHPMPAPASEPIRRPTRRPVSRRAEDRTRIHQDRMITERTIAPHHQASPDLGSHVFSRPSPLTLYHHGPLQPANRPGSAL